MRHLFTEFQFLCPASLSWILADRDCEQVRSVVKTEKMKRDKTSLEIWLA